MENRNENSRLRDDTGNQRQSPNAGLTITSVTIQTAKAFVAWTQRHLGPPTGAKFAIGVQSADGTLVGVVIVGRPVARAFDDDRTAEITRLSTDGTPNACSTLLGAAGRAAKAMGYRRLITPARTDEPGTSLRAAGFQPVVELPPRQGWDTPSRRRISKGADNVARILWEIVADGEDAHAANSRQRHSGQSGMVRVQADADARSECLHSDQGHPAADQPSKELDGDDRRSARRRS